MVVLKEDLEFEVSEIDERLKKLDELKSDKWTSENTRLDICRILETLRVDVDRNTKVGKKITKELQELEDTMKKKYSLSSVVNEISDYMKTLPTKVQVG